MKKAIEPQKTRMIVLTKPVEQKPKDSAEVQKIELGEVHKVENIVAPFNFNIGSSFYSWWNFGW